MKTRIISGLVMAPLLLIVYFGGPVLTLGCFIIGIMGVREFYNGFHALDIHPSYWIAAFSALALYGINLAGLSDSWYMIWFFGVVIASLLYLFRIDERKLEDAMATITGIFYVLLSYLARIILKFFVKRHVTTASTRSLMVVTTEAMAQETVKKLKDQMYQQYVIK